MCVLLIGKRVVSITVKARVILLFVLHLCLAQKSFRIWVFFITLSKAKASTTSRRPYKLMYLVGTRTKLELKVE